MSATQKRALTALCTVMLLLLTACTPVAMAADKSPHHVVTAYAATNKTATLELYAPIVEEFCYTTIEITKPSPDASPGDASFEIRYTDNTVQDIDAGDPGINDEDNIWLWAIPPTKKPCQYVRLTYTIQNIDSDVPEINAVIRTAPADKITAVGPLRAAMPDQEQTPPNNPANNTANIIIIEIGAAAIAALMVYVTVQSIRSDTKTRRRHK